MAIDETSETRIPVTLLTGFLGSGKTTLLNHWLRDPALADAAVIVNEFGEIGIDHALIASSNDNTIELSTGCLCCTVQGDLVETLRDLRAKRSAGQIPAFDRVLIETTGMADVVPVIQALMTFPVARSFRLNRVLTVVDAVNGPGTLAAHPEAIKQVAVADALIVTKTDLPDARAAALVDTLAQVNPGATRLVCDPAARPDATVLDGPDVYDVNVRPEQARQWLNAAPYADGHGHGHHHEHTHAHDHARIDSFCLDFAAPPALVPGQRLAGCAGHGASRRAAARQGHPAHSRPRTAHRAASGAAPVPSACRVAAMAGRGPAIPHGFHYQRPEQGLRHAGLGHGARARPPVCRPRGLIVSAFPITRKTAWTL